MLNILSYSFIHSSPKSKCGGGEGIYIHNIYRLIEKYVLNIFIEGSFVPISVEIEDANIKKTIIGVIYRPPDINIHDNFLENIQLTLHNIASESKTSYIMGDSHINLLDNTDLSINFLNIMFPPCLRQWIHTPTTLNTDGNVTTNIDKIFSSTYMQLHSGTIPYDISDHLPIFCTTYENNQ